MKNDYCGNSRSTTHCTSMRVKRRDCTRFEGPAPNQGGCVSVFLHLWPDKRGSRKQTGHAASSVSKSTTKPMPTGPVCAVGHCHPGKGQFRRQTCGKGFAHFIPFDLPGRFIE